MKFSCEKAILQEAISVASRAVSTKTTIPALECLLLSATESGVILSGYDLKTGIQYPVSADVAEPGAVCLNARLFGDIIRKLPDDVITVSVDDKLMTTISCGVTTFNIIASSADEFPELPEVGRGGALLRMSAKALKSMISETIFAVSENENKPIHTGCLFECTHESLTMVAVDGYRLALRREKLELPPPEISFVVPGPALKEIERILPETDENVSVWPELKHILFDIGGVIIISRLLEGEFLNYRNTIPKDHAIEFVCDVKSLIASIERVSLLISEKIKNPVRCTFDENVVKLSCITAIGKAYDECRLNGRADGLEIGFNSRYLLDALRAVKDDTAVLRLKSGLAPCIITPKEGDKYLYLVLPVRLRSN